MQPRAGACGGRRQRAAHRSSAPMAPHSPAHRRRRRRRESGKAARKGEEAAARVAVAAAALGSSAAAAADAGGGEGGQQGFSSTVDVLELKGTWRPPNPELSTLALTTGSQLMLEVHASLAAYICKKLADPATAHLRWVGRVGWEGGVE